FMAAGITVVLPARRRGTRASETLTAPCLSGRWASCPPGPGCRKRQGACPPGSDAVRLRKSIVMGGDGGDAVVPSLTDLSDDYRIALWRGGELQKRCEGARVRKVRRVLGARVLGARVLSARVLGAQAPSAERIDLRNAGSTSDA